MLYLRHASVPQDPLQRRNERISWDYRTGKPETRHHKECVCVFKTRKKEKETDTVFHLRSQVKMDIKYFVFSTDYGSVRRYFLVGAGSRFFC